MKIKEFVNVYKNKVNKQVKFEIKKNKLKEFKLDIDDILNTPLEKKLNNFKNN